MIVHLVLENYIPLLSAGIKRVELNTEQLVNLFISKSGSGKSSILKELNPLPAENADYKNGLKQIIILDNGKRYVLTSKTQDSSGHSFRVHENIGEKSPFAELNPNGTSTVQKELVERHFKMDNGLTNVANGIALGDRFSIMSAARRKDIFMKIYPNDTRFALGVWQKLKVERNELKATIKNQIIRHTEEHRKLKDVEALEDGELEKRIQEIEGELKESLLVRGQLESAKIDPRLNDHVQEFTRLVDQLAVNKVSGFLLTKGELETTLARQQVLLGVHREQASVIQRMISENASHLEGLDDFLKNPEIYKQQSEQIKEEILQTELKISQYSAKLDTLPVFKEKEANFEGLVEVVPTFLNFLRRVELVSNPNLTGTMYRKLQLELESVKADQRETKLRLDDTQHRVTHITNSETIACPDCTFQFKLGVNPDELKNLILTQTALEKRLTGLKEREAVLIRDLDNDSDWFLTMKQLFVFIQDNSHVLLLAELVKQYEIGQVIHTPLCNALEAFVERSKYERHLSTLNTEAAVVEARIGLLDRNNLLDVAVYLNGLEEDLVIENNAISFNQKKITQLTRQLKTILDYETNVARVRVLAMEIEHGFNSRDRVNFRQVVDQRITALTLDKEDRLANIIKNRSLSAVVESISNDIKALQLRLKAVETWMDGLCPNKGKIGKMMNTFINTFCANVNAVIQCIWDTPLYVLPCSKENGDLTYKFPVKKTTPDPTPDIAQCSAGESDVIDWAFRFVMLSYLPASFPLIMDEVGISFDEIKRVNFLRFIQEYTGKPNARQLFMVSHYVNVNGGFVKPNIIALKYEGLTLPGTPNENTAISHAA